MIWKSNRSYNKVLLSGAVNRTREQWPIEKIFMIGGKKRLVEKFDWEIFG